VTTPKDTARAKIPHFLSLGAGVQSSAMALMASAGEIGPMPTAAIFADTQAEPTAVYEWLGWLEKQLPFPVYRVGKGSLRADSLTVKRSKNTGRLYSNPLIPAFVLNKDGSVGLFGRKCTADYKLGPVNKKVKEVAGVKRGEKSIVVVQWVGISTDEAMRMKPSRQPWTKTRWPLIEEMMSRKDCLAWMEARGFPEPPRSACTFCPFHSNGEWANLRDVDPVAFADAARFEAELQESAAQSESATGIPFLHRSCKPLQDVDLDAPAKGWKDPDQLGLFGNDCEGLCGV
jgi:hypothetical protein